MFFIFLSTGIKAIWIVYNLEQLLKKPVCSQLTLLVMYTNWFMKKIKLRTQFYKFSFMWVQIFQKYLNFQVREIQSSDGVECVWESTKSRLYSELALFKISWQMSRVLPPTWLDIANTMNFPTRCCMTLYLKGYQTRTELIRSEIASLDIIIRISINISISIIRISCY